MTRKCLTCAVPLLLSLLTGIDGGCATNSSIPSDTEIQKPVPTDADQFRRLRERMVSDQLQARDIRDGRVLGAMLKVPRHVFVPPGIVSSAYEDTALPLALGQTISQPYIVAYMTEVLHLQGTERVLEIGTGSGYQAAVLAEIVPEVFTVEILPELLKRAQTTLGSLGYKNIHFRAADGYQGWPEFAPFDCIIVTAAPDHVPQPLIDQLKSGGRMIIPVGRFEQDLILVEKERSGIARRTTIPVRFVPMTGKAQQNIPR
jgi:protein-L-isoaspartate(D-aspartate) O-methyltransferase